MREKDDEVTESSKSAQSSDDQRKDTALTEHERKMKWPVDGEDVDDRNIGTMGRTPSRR